MTYRAATDPRFTPIMLRGDLVDAGWNDRAIARMCREGVWVRIRHGAYVDSRAWLELDDAGRHELRARAVLRQADTELVLSHASGVPLYDAPSWGLDLTTVHVTRIDGKAGRREAGVRQHRGRIYEGDVVERHGVRVMRADRLALEVTTAASTEAALVVVNHLLHAGETTQERLAERYAREICSWPCTLRTDLVLRLADGRLESPGESRAFYLCYRAGLPMPVPQYEIRDERGEVIARVDFAWPELGAFMEFDGKVKYHAHLKEGESPADAVVREKRREELIVERTGWRCVRLSWADLDHLEQTVQRIRRALSQPSRVAG